MKKNKPEFVPFIKRCAQFELDKLKAATEVIPPATATTNSTAAPKNPYAVAKAQLLASYEPWRRNELLQFEAKKDLDNRFYTAFVKEIAALGDKLMG
jgi:hypothetical protein